MTFQPSDGTGANPPSSPRDPGAAEQPAPTSGESSASPEPVAASGTSQPSPQDWTPSEVADSPAGNAAASQSDQSDDSAQTPSPHTPAHDGSPTGEHKMPIPLPPRAGAPAGSAYGYPTRYAEAPGSGRFRLALPQLGTIVSGPAVGSMVAGVGSLVVAIGMGCLGLFAAPILTIAIVVLALFCSVMACLLGAVAMRQVKRGEGEYRGTGMALAGLICGGVAALITVLVGAVSLLISI